MANNYGDIITESEAKDLLYDLVNTINWTALGTAASYSTLDFILNVGRREYFNTSNRISAVKCVQNDDPILYEKLAVFFKQNRPEGSGEEIDEF